MIFLIFAILALVTSGSNIIRVVDGDTVLISAPWVPAPLKPEIYLRLNGIDCPEIARAKCLKEKILGQSALDFVEKFLTLGEPVVAFKSWDKYGGRILGDISVNGVDMAESLYLAGLAKMYFGDEKQSWCDEKLNKSIP